MKFNKYASFVSGVILGSLLVGSMAMASSKMNLEVSTDPLRYIIFGQEVQPGDKQGMYFNGKTYVPAGFIYQGTTFVPIRFISESMGNKVEWDGETRTITISQPASSASYEEISREQAPQAVQDWVDRSLKMELGQSMTVGDKTYLLITRGEKNTGGFDVEVSGIQDRGDHWEVSVTYTDPGENPVIQVFTYPYTLIAMDKTDKPIQFTEVNEQYLPQLVGITTLPPVEKESTNIKVFAPQANDNGVVVSGVARVFEGALQYEVKGSDGSIKSNGYIQALAGGGDWGYFTFTLPLSDWENKRTIELFSASPKDGARENQVQMQLGF